MNTITKIVVIIAMALLVVGGTSCNTVHGAGQDVKHVGNSIENAAR